MEKRKLLDYLETVIDLEKTILTDQMAIDDMNYKISILGIPKNFVQPSAPQKPTYEKEPKIVEYKNTYGDTKAGIKLFAYGLGGIVLLLFFIKIFIPWEIGMLRSSSLLDGFIAIIGILAGLAIAASIPVLLIMGISGFFSTIIGYIKDTSNNKKESKRANDSHYDALERIKNANEKKQSDYNKKYAEYKKDYSNYLDNVRSDQQRVAAEKYQIIAINWEKGMVEEALKKANETLEKYYRLDILKPKYRNLAYSAQIYDYLYNGLCDQLEGAHNAYYILEEELRMQRLIDKIDVVITNLERIQSNQYKLYTVVLGINQTMLKIKNAVSEISHSYAKQSDLLVKENNRLISTLQNNQQLLNTKIDEATRNLQNSMAIEHKNSEIGLYLSEQNKKNLDYIADYVQYKDDRFGATRY